MCVSHTHTSNLGRVSKSECRVSFLWVVCEVCVSFSRFFEQIIIHAVAYWWLVWFWSFSVRFVRITLSVCFVWYFFSLFGSTNRPNKIEILSVYILSYNVNTWRKQVTQKYHQKKITTDRNYTRKKNENSRIVFDFSFPFFPSSINAFSWALSWVSFFGYSIPHTTKQERFFFGWFQCCWYFVRSLEFLRF